MHCCSRFWVKIFFFYSSFFSHPPTHTHTHTNTHSHLSDIRSLLLCSGSHSPWEELAVFTDWGPNSEKQRFPLVVWKGEGGCSPQERKGLGWTFWKWYYSWVVWTLAQGVGGGRCVHISAVDIRTYCWDGHHQSPCHRQGSSSETAAGTEWELLTGSSIILGRAENLRSDKCTCQPWRMMDVGQNCSDKKNKEALWRLNWKNSYHDSQGSAHCCPHDCDSLQQEDVERNQQREKVHQLRASKGPLQWIHVACA